MYVTHYQNQDRKLVTRSQEELNRAKVLEINIANSANIIKSTNYSRSSRGRIEDVPSTNKYQTDSGSDVEWRGTESDYSSTQRLWPSFFPSINYSPDYTVKQPLLYLPLLS